MNPPNIARGTVRAVVKISGIFEGLMLPSSTASFKE